MDIGPLGARRDKGQDSTPTAWWADPLSLLPAGDTEAQWLAHDRAG